MPTAAELLAALPAEDAGESRQSHAKALEAIFQGLSQKQVPTGAVRRFCSVGGLSARLGLAYMAYWIRTWYRPIAASEQDLLETHLRSALNMVATMGYLRGAVAKVGQLMTSFPESLPRQFVDVLGSLHFQAPPMHYSLIREQLINELGDPEQIFAEFDRQAIAAASLGQVHRARLKNGQEVAVKIQYPGIARTIQADMCNLKMLMRPLLFSQDWKSVEAMFDEIRTGLEAETDYVQEAQNLRDVQQILAGSDGIVVPEVYEPFSTRRVLTMQFLEGQTMDEFLAGNPSQERRDDFGEKISRALYLVFLHRMLYSDAHPGNFIFLPDDQLGLVDFGNVRRFNEEEWQYHCDVAAAREGSEEDVIAICKRSLMMTDKDAERHAEMLNIVVEGFRYYNEPLQCEGKFDYADPDYLKRGADWLSRGSKTGWVKQQPVNMFAHRLNFQTPALLFRLRSRVDVGQLIRDFGARTDEATNGDPPTD